jgi:hypothetical protein
MGDTRSAEKTIEGLNRSSLEKAVPRYTARRMQSMEDALRSAFGSQ